MKQRAQLLFWKLAHRLSISMPTNFSNLDLLHHILCYFASCSPTNILTADLSSTMNVGRCFPFHPFVIHSDVFLKTKKNNIYIEIAFFWRFIGFKFKIRNIPLIETWVHIVSRAICHQSRWQQRRWWGSDTSDGNLKDNQHTQMTPKHT